MFNTSVGWGPWCSLLCLSTIQLVPLSGTYCMAWQNFYRLPWWWQMGVKFPILDISASWYNCLIRIEYFPPTVEKQHSFINLWSNPNLVHKPWKAKRPCSLILSLIQSKLHLTNPCFVYHFETSALIFFKKTNDLLPVCSLIPISNRYLLEWPYEFQWSEVCSYGSVM